MTKQATARDFTRSDDDMGVTIHEAAEFIFRSAMEHASTRDITSTDDGKSSCMTVRIPVYALRRLREAIDRVEAL
jgi:hypothetical protein